MRLNSALSVLDPPIVILKIGQLLNLNDIKEGDDVYFECHIDANPKPHKIEWFFNVGIQNGFGTVIQLKTLSFPCVF